MNFPRKQEGQKPWTTDEIERVRRHVKEGGGFSFEETRALSLELGRTASAVKGMVGRIRRGEV